MRVDSIYEVFDYRQEPLLDGLCGIRPMPGALSVTPMAPTSISLEWDDDDHGAFVDDEINGTIEVHTDTGRVVFVELTFQEWLDNHEPFLSEPGRKLDTIEDVRAWVGGHLG